MPNTAVEKLLARASGLGEVSPGEVVEAAVDRVMVHDGNASLLFHHFAGGEGFFDPSRVVFVTDHFAPPSTMERAGIVAEFRRFAARTGVANHYEMEGICHQLMAEKGHVRPSECVIAIDSHAVMYGALGAFGCGMGATDTAYILKTGKTWLRVPETIGVSLRGVLKDGVTAFDAGLELLSRLKGAKTQYASIEFTKEAVSTLTVDSRLALCTLATEAGVKSAFMPVDGVTREYLAGIGVSGFDATSQDPGADHAMEVDVDLGGLERRVSLPHHPANVVPVGDAEGTEIDQAFIGSCASGRLEDLRTAASALEGKKVAKGVRLVVTPASRKVYMRAMDEGTLATLSGAGAVVTNPSCGACPGIDKGLLAEGEACIAASGRNFRGRMGSMGSEVYLGSPYTVARSAVKGSIC